MLICGLKLTHDAAVALLDDNRLLFCVEIEKLAGNPRYSEMESASQISAILGAFGTSPEKVDAFVVDGWGASAPLEPWPEDPADRQSRVLFRDGSTVHPIAVAEYQDREPGSEVAGLVEYFGLPIDGRFYPYASSRHIAGHVLSAYCTSPFAREGEDAHILVWDGGVFPTMYFVSARSRSIRNVGTLFRLFGNAYAQFARRFRPFRDSDEHGLSTAGKVMAYVATGETRPEVLGRIKKTVRERNTFGYDFPRKLARWVEAGFPDSGYSGADYIRTFHDFLENLLCATLEQYVRRHRADGANLCLSGGCALNIKWNSAIRATGLFRSIYVPPFPNDSGSALGAGCTRLFERDLPLWLDWSVYAGPKLVDEPLPDGWQQRPCSVEDLAALLHLTDDPVVFLSGRAELGPRALGNRSILAPARSPAMKDRLNRLKDREPYRPVAPICLETRAPEIFDPGTSDPYMLFDHRVREVWRERIPAVMHLDGTARLQTVGDRDHPLLARLLRAYERLSGIPVLCNTSANASGTGFFPSVRAAMLWGRLDRIWSENILYERS